MANQAVEPLATSWSAKSTWDELLAASECFTQLVHVGPGPEERASPGYSYWNSRGSDDDAELVSP
jgi:hypothetical protein